MRRSTASHRARSSSSPSTPQANAADAGANARPAATGRPVRSQSRRHVQAIAWTAVQSPASAAGASMSSTARSRSSRFMGRDIDCSA